ncbi:TRAP transporter large permease [Lentilitoribacter sp. EG35]|uniref:TRAP transporter large permease n=1 Tax=Lentilitoribacter sp. EG35 TaxID=3234192 RepID=UPI0034616DC5
MEFITPEFMCAALVCLVATLLLFGFPVAFTLAGSSLIIAAIGAYLGVLDWAIMTAFPQRVFSIMTNEVLIAVVLFVFMGVMLERSKLAEELLENMARIFGSKPGGIAYAVCIVGALLAASTGIAGATVVTMGLLSLPVMIRRGYDPSLSCGIITASGTLGQIIPPSIILVILGDQLSVAYQNAQFEQGIFSPDTVSVNELFAGALFPGFVLVSLYVLYIFVRTMINPAIAPAMPPEDNANGDNRLIWKLLGSLIPPIFLIVAVLGSILAGIASPTEAAAVGGGGAILLASYKLNVATRTTMLAGLIAFAVMVTLALGFDLRSQRDVVTTKDWIAIAAAFVATCVFLFAMAVALRTTFKERSSNGLRVLAQVMRSTMSISSMVFVILIGAAMFSLVFRGFGGDEIIEEWLKSLPGGTLSAVLIVMIIMFFLGFFLDYLEIVFIVVPIVAPVLLQMEVAPGVLMSPVWLGVMMALNLQTSYLTPPFGYALFFLRGVAPDTIRTGQIYKGVIPFVLIQLFCLVILWFFPNLAIWLPAQIYGG